MNNKHPNLFDLPNEILFIIINKLNISDVFYSLADVNKRFGQLVLDPVYIQNVDVTVMTMNSFYSRTFSVHEKVLSRICENILSKFHDQVKKLAIEQDSIERILSLNYSQLYSLSLVNFKEEILFQYLKDYSILRDLLTKQITHLNIDIQNEKLSKISSNIFVLILPLCKRLINLNFCQLFSYRNLSICICERTKASWRSSTLIELKINVSTFDDCLFLLDGSFDSLSKLIINVKQIKSKPSNINNSRKLPKLKCFSLSSINYTHDYDEHIIPLLRRMINLQELILFLSVIRADPTFIGGIDLYTQVLIQMSHLNKFVFSINTGVLIKNNKIPSNEDIQHSFTGIGREHGQVASYVHFEPRTPRDISSFKQVKGVVKSHIYSLPYQFESFLRLNNSFQGGIFVKVRCLTMNDTRPFEHQLFKIISDDFPFLKELNIHNGEPQKEKQHPSTLIHFPHLILLNLVKAHVDYAEQFLVDTNTHLPCLLDLEIKYESLAMVTNNFTNDATRLYCVKLKRLHIDNPFVRLKHFDEYFPLLL